MRFVIDITQEVISVCESGDLLRTQPYYIFTQNITKGNFCLFVKTFACSSCTKRKQNQSSNLKNVRKLQKHCVIAPASTQVRGYVANVLYHFLTYIILKNGYRNIIDSTWYLFCKRFPYPRVRIWCSNQCKLVMIMYEELDDCAYLRSSLDSNLSICPDWFGKRAWCLAYLSEKVAEDLAEVFVDDWKC